MPTFTKQVTADDGSTVELTRVVADPAEATTLSAAGWTQTDATAAPTRQTPKTPPATPKTDKS